MKQTKYTIILLIVFLITGANGFAQSSDWVADTPSDTFGNEYGINYTTSSLADDTFYPASEESSAQRTRPGVGTNPGVNGNIPIGDGLLSVILVLVAIHAIYIAIRSRRKELS